jgi:hypothetical protein
MNVLQEWVGCIPMMQQTVLLTAVRGPDGLPKYNGIKMLLRWYRRCVLLSAMDGQVLTNPLSVNGGSFTGPSLDAEHWPESDWEAGMDGIVDTYMKEVDAVPHHFQMHFMHAVEIVGYKHADDRIRCWWRRLYARLVAALHLHPETEVEMDARLGDSREGWLRRADRATVA